MIEPQADVVETEQKPADWLTNWLTDWLTD